MKDVIITVRGMQPEVDAEEPIEVISTGTYHCKAGTHYLRYEEADDEGRITKNRITITENSVELTKQGAVTTQMFFTKGEQNFSCFQTPFGELLLGMTTKSLTLTQSEQLFQVRLVYGLEINGVHVSECELAIEVIEVGA